MQNPTNGTTINNNRMSNPKFDTCFFERYAQISLENLLGPQYGDLVNKDRPDLQMIDRSLGIEVTRAMEESKNVAETMLMEMAGLDVSDEDRDDFNKIKSSGYGYGLQAGQYIGHLEYEYWALAQPLKRILKSKIEKVASGFYGDFKKFGLYVFCKDELSHSQVESTLAYVLELQNSLDICYSTLYLSQIDRMYVCSLELSDKDQQIIIPPRNLITTYQISPQMRKDFFMQAL